MNEWMNKSLPGIVDKLEKSINKGCHIQTEEGLNLSGRAAIYEVLDDLLTGLFPGAYGREKVPKEELNFFLGDLMRHTFIKLVKQLKEVLVYHCKEDICEKCTCGERAESSAIYIIESLPGVRDLLLTDIAAAFAGDPAANSEDEVLLSYPCIEAVATYRIAHLMYEKNIPIIPRIMTERAHSHTGIDIHPGAKIGSHFFIDHGTGVVIGETCTIGNNVKMYQGVTLGALSPFDSDGKPRKGEKRHPNIEDDVIIYANATILGGKTVIGKGAIVGANTWITESVPAGKKVYRK